MTQVLEVCTQGDLWVMIDANARSGPGDGHHIFEHDDVSSVNTPLLRDFVSTFDLVLPSTTHVHQGDHHTWTSPDGGMSLRIDYVLVPRHRLSACTHSSLIPEFDLGHAHDDHTAVGVQMQWKVQRFLTSGTLSGEARPLPTNWELEHCKEALRSLPLTPWQQDVDTQVEAIQSHLHRTLAPKRPPTCSSAPKKPYIDDKIWQLRQEKLSRKKTYRQIGQALRREVLATFFQCWPRRHWLDKDKKWHVPLYPECPDQQYFHSLLAARLKAFGQFQLAARQLRKSLKQAKHSALNACLEALPKDTPFFAMLEQLKSFIGPTNPNKRKVKSLPYLLDEHGAPILDSAGQQERWIDFFSNMEGGTRVTAAELRSNWIQSLKDIEAHDPEDPIRVEDLPSLMDLESALRAAPMKKAVGPDGLPAELCKVDPGALAHRLYPLLWKILLHGQEPLQYKGGRLTPIYKGKGAHGEVASHRSILVSNHLGKCLHKAIRTKTYGLYESFVHSSQLGGRRKIPVAVGVHFARAFLRGTGERHQAAALLFVDLKEAFYRLFRPLALGNAISDEDIAAAFCRLGMPTSALSDLRTHLLQEDCALQQAGLQPFQRRAIACIHSCTWFRLPLQRDYVQTSMGSRPGDCFADTVFSFIYARVLHTLEARLTEADLVVTVPDAPPGLELPATGGSHTQLGPIWMDDTCLFIQAADSELLRPKLSAVTSITLDVLREYGLTPNLAVGKTELLVKPCGKGSRKLKNEFFGPISNGMLPVLGEYQFDQVRVTGTYKHLGGIISCTATSCREIRQRVSLAHKAFSDHRRLLYQNQAIGQKQRLQAFNSLVLSKLVYGMESWVLATDATTKFFHSAVMRLYRRLLKLRPQDLVSDAEVLFKLQLPSPSVILIRARLRYFGLLFGCGSAVDWGLLLSDSAWVAQIRQDLAWLWEQLAHASPLRDPTDHLPQWIEIMQYSPRYWKRLVNRAAEHAIAQHANAHYVTTFHEELYDLLLQADYNIEPVPLLTLEDPPATFACMRCAKRFRSKAGQGAHFFKVHGVVAETRTRFDTTACGCCLKEFHTAGKLKSHLRYSTQCARHLRGRRFICDPLPGIGSRVDEENAAMHYGQRPDDDRQADVDLVARQLEEDLQVALLDCRDLQLLEPAFRSIIRRHAVSWETCCITLQAVVDQYSDTEGELTGIAVEDVRALCQGLQQEEAWDFLRQTLETKHAIDLSALEDAFAEICSRDKGLRPSHPFVLSVDIVIDEKYGNLMHPDTQEFWLWAARSHLVVGLLAGPPCNSWSRVRRRTLDDGRRGPRPIRSPQHPWALPSLSLGELTQIFGGNVLLAFAFKLFYALLVYGGVGLIEHPDEPETEDDVTIWKLPLVRAVTRHPDVWLHHTTQGFHGSEGLKPTGLLALRVPDLATSLQQWQLSPQRQRHHQTTGRAVTGEFCTAKLKEYPPAYCGGIASALGKALASHSIDSNFTYPQDFSALCCKLVSSSRGATIGHDTRTDS
eukprot:Skav228673  [mRNA]  locus=scaffold1332:626815:631419:- [translate_table: standard]